MVRFESGHAGSASLESLTRVLDALGLYATVGEAVDDEGLDSLMPGPDSLDVFER